MSEAESESPSAEALEAERERVAAGAREFAATCRQAVEAGVPPSEVVQIAQAVLQEAIGGGVGRQML